MEILNNESRIKLLVLKEINRVIRGHQLDKKQTLTVGDISQFIDIAITNVRAAEKLKSTS